MDEKRIACLHRATHSVLESIWKPAGLQLIVKPYREPIQLTFILAFTVLSFACVQVTTTAIHLSVAG